MTLLAALISLVAFPGLAGARHEPKPACVHYSTKKIQKTISGDTKLHLAGTVGSFGCAFLGHLHKHYEMSVDVGEVAGSQALWKKMERKARKAAANQGAKFKTLSTGNPKVFEYSQIQTGNGNPPCPPHYKLPNTGPPSCSGAPSWWHQDAWAYGTLAGTKKKMIVSAEIYAELGDAATGSAVDLVKHILDGKLK